jgi:hypothetical protein
MPQVVQDAPPETAAERREEVMGHTHQTEVTIGSHDYARMKRWEAAYARWGIYTATLIATLFIAAMSVSPIIGMVGFVASVIGIIWTAQSYFQLNKALKQTRRP